MPADVQFEWPNTANDESPRWLSLKQGLIPRISSNVSFRASVCTFKAIAIMGLGGIG